MPDTETTTEVSNTGDSELAGYLIDNFNVRPEVAIQRDVQDIFLQAQDNGNLEPFLNAFTNALDGYQGAVTSSFQNIGGLSGDQSNPFRQYQQDLAGMQAIARFDAQFGGMLDFGAAHSPFAANILDMNQQAMMSFGQQHNKIMSYFQQQQGLIGSMNPLAGVSRF